MVTSMAARGPGGAADGAYAWLRLGVVTLLGTIGSVGMWSVVVALPAVQAEFATARGGVAFNLRIVFVVPHAAPNSGTGSEPRQFHQTEIERVVFGGNKVASHEGHLWVQTIAGIHHARKVLCRVERAHMNVAELQQREPVKFVW